MTPNAGRITTSVRGQPIGVLAGVGEEPDPHRPQLVVDVRVVDDFAGEEDVAIGEALARLVGVVDRAVDAVAEPELAREVHGQPAGAVREVVGLDPLDDRAVIVVGQHAGDGMLQVEAFAEDQRRHQQWGGVVPTLRPTADL